MQLLIPAATRQIHQRNPPDVYTLEIFLHGRELDFSAGGTDGRAQLRRSDAVRWVASIARWASENGALNLNSKMAMTDAMVTIQLRDALSEHVRKMVGETSYILRVLRFSLA